MSGSQRPRAAIWISAALLAVAVAGCGSDGSGGTPRGQVTVATVAPDSYDPALFSTLEALEPLQTVYLGLVTYAHKEGNAGMEVIPGLARSLPKVTDGGRVYSFTLRKGLRFSDGTPVKASDFEFAIKRLLTLGGPYSTFFGGIAGATAYQDRKQPRSRISGLVTDDAKGTIRIELDAPDGKFLYALAGPYAAPVPASKATFESMTNDPPPGAGPYVLSVKDPKREYRLTRNTRYRELPGIPKGKIETFVGQVSANVGRMTRRVISNEADFMTADPTGGQLPEVRRSHGDRLREDASPPNTYFFFLNASLPPFDRLEARQAVNFALDSRALARIFNGRLEPGCTFLPPGVAGHEDYECPYGDPDGPGDVDRARDLVEKSGTKGEKVIVWTNSQAPRPAIADYYVGVLDDIGFDAEKRVLDDEVYFDRVGTESTEAQTGFTNWYQDFPHPADFFQPLLSADALQANPTTNLGRIDDAGLSSEIERLTRNPDLDEIASRWGELDKKVVGPEKAYIVPYGYEKATTFFSEKMDFDRCSGVHSVYKNDWLQFCEK